eukprot:symbB.v1.2.002143.t1/scaffold106.1/size366728/31
MAGATELPEQPALRQRVRVYGREVMESSSEYKLLQQTRDEATTTRRIALGSLLVALCSVVAVYMFQNGTSTGSSITLRESFPGNMEEIQPGWAWTTVPAIVRSDKSLKSKQLGIVQGDTRVMVKEVKGIRARISEPMAGWISCISGDVQVVTKHEDEQLQQIKKRIMAHQKSQRDLLAALENVKKKGQLHPKLLGEIKEATKTRQLAACSFHAARSSFFVVQQQLLQLLCHDPLPGGLPTRRELSVLLPLLGAGQAGKATALSKDEQLVTSLFERVTPGVVSIAKEAPPEDSLGTKPSAGLAGSGFVWDNSHVVTNYHVINELQTPFVTFLQNDKSGNKRLSYLAQVVGYDSTSDVAVLEVQSQDKTSLPRGWSLS